MRVADWFSRLWDVKDFIADLNTGVWVTQTHYSVDRRNLFA